jgi:hypothetical protein
LCTRDAATSSSVTPSLAMALTCAFACASRPQRALRLPQHAARAQPAASLRPRLLHALRASDGGAAESEELAAAKDANAHLQSEIERLNTELAAAFDNVRLLQLRSQKQRRIR